MKKRTKPQSRLVILFERWVRQERAEEILKRFGIPVESRSQFVWSGGLEFTTYVSPRKVRKLIGKLEKEEDVKSVQ